MQTIMSAEGSYSHEPKKVIMTVVNRDQALKLRKFVRSVEPHAFMMITNSSEIIGKRIPEYDVGKTTKGEIDFVAVKDGKKEYYQVAYLLATEDVIEREFGAYKDIQDNYPK